MEVVFITGASSGIGKFLAINLLKQGYSVAAFARREERLKELTGALIIPGDVTDKNSLELAQEQIQKKWGRIDWVIANAGYGVNGLLKNLDISEFHKQFDVNITGVLNTLQVFYPSLKKSQGKAVLMGSVAGHLSLPNISPYSMSKFAIRALAQSLWSEWALEGIQVTLISPGFVKSEFRNIDNDGNFRLNAKDPIPSWLSMETDTAARKIICAIKKRKREYVLTVHGKIIVTLVRFFPFLVPWIGKIRSS